MKIVVSSKNPAKIQAVQQAFEECFPGVPLILEAISVSSGVSDQPMSDAETREGAHNRAQAANLSVPVADYWVGLEGGLEVIDSGLFASAWMVIVDAHGNTGEARTPTLPLPPEVARLVGEGLELGEANDRVFSTHNSKQAGGAFGLLTEGKLTRGGIYAQALVLALVPLTHDLWKPS